MSPLNLYGRIEAVVIGASAGGVEALTRLLPSLVAGGRLSVFVVLHVPRERSSLQIDVFALGCTVAVLEAQDKLPIEPDTVYFAPPDYHLLIETAQRMALSVDEPLLYSRPSIDVLFESAAAVYGQRLLGVVLSGASEDGAAGLEAVRRAGGLTLVQDPATAQVSLMPAAALKRAAPDFILPLDQIAELFRLMTTRPAAWRH